LGTAFTYQGQLKRSGEPVTDDCEMAFRLHDAATEGSQAGVAITRTVTISHGLFTENLDFGSGVFAGDRRWLGVRVKCPGDSVYAHLGRQELTAAPYALYAVSTGALHSYPITSTAPAMGQVLKWNGSAWAPAADESGGAGDFWSLTGNSGTTPGIHFLGTTDGLSLTLAVSGTAALRLEPATDYLGYYSPNVVGGHSANVVTASIPSAPVAGATIGGGGRSDSPNHVTARYGTVGGGAGNQAGNEYATVGGGFDNMATGNMATVSGGGANRANGDRSAIGGGSANVADASYATVPGGWNAKASLYGQMAYASGPFGAAGDAQASLYVLRNETLNQTPTELFLDGSWRRLTVASGRTLTFDALIVGRSNGGQSAGYSAQGVIENVAGTVSLIGTSTITATALGEDNASWDVVAEADAAHSALIIKVTGAAGASIRWVALVRAVEVAW
jgi:hypothetical protein